MGMASVARAGDVSSAAVQGQGVQGQIADWSLIQSKGGIKVGLAIQEKANAWKFDLVCDLSANGSGLVIQKTVVQQEGKNIFISLVVSRTVWTLTPERGQCKSVVLDSDPGLHQVFYRDAAGKTYPLGFVEFNLDSNVLNSPSG